MERPRQGCEGRGALVFLKYHIEELVLYPSGHNPALKLCEEGRSQEGSPVKTLSRNTNPEPHGDSMVKV
jgi:hypothetical protein